MLKSRPRQDDESGRSVFVPILLVVLALLVMTGFQSFQLLRESELLKTRLELQTEPLQESKNVSQQFESVAKSTADLARKGNANAQRIVQELEKAGVKINLETGATN